MASCALCSTTLLYSTILLSSTTLLLYYILLYSTTIYSTTLLFTIFYYSTTLLLYYILLLYYSTTLLLFHYPTILLLQTMITRALHRAPHSIRTVSKWADSAVKKQVVAAGRGHYVLATGNCSDKGNHQILTCFLQFTPGIRAN